MKLNLSIWTYETKLTTAFAALVGAMVLLLHLQGRIWWCACGGLDVWNGQIFSSHTSQHFFDHYSFTHVLHGVVFFGLAWVLFPRTSYGWRMWCAVFLEALWELLENSPIIIQRYREATIDKGYMGDSIGNSVADLVSCAVGFAIASRLGLKKSIAFYIAVEVILLFWIRDNLTLNVVMLLFPIEAIKQWQAGGSM